MGDGTDRASRDAERTLDEIAAAATLAGGCLDAGRLRGMPLGEALALLYPNGVRLRVSLLRSSGTVED